MLRKKKFIIVGAVLAALVIFGTIGGIALADDNAATTTVADKFAAKVATILGIDEAKVQDAFAQAREELRSEALDDWLAQLVADGKVTQAQADAYKAWQGAKPEGFEGLGPGAGRMPRMRGFGGCPMPFGAAAD